MRSRKGFTLIEMLVVIAILLVMIALLMPVMEKARLAAMNVTCASNLRQQYMGHMAYASDHNGWLVQSRKRNGWPEYWQKPGGTCLFPQDYIQTYFGVSRAVFQSSMTATGRTVKLGCLSCPSRKEADHKYTGTWPTIDYVINGDVLSGVLGTATGVATAGRDHEYKLNMFRHPSQLMFLMCTMIVENGHGEVSVPWDQYVYWTSAGVGVNSTGNVKFQCFSHDGDNFWCAFDGHVESLRYNDEGIRKLGGLNGGQTKSVTDATYPRGILLEKY